MAGKYDGINLINLKIIAKEKGLTVPPRAKKEDVRDLLEQFEANAEKAEKAKKAETAAKSESKTVKTTKKTAEKAKATEEAAETKKPEKPAAAKKKVAEAADKNSEKDAKKESEKRQEEVASEPAKKRGRPKKQENKTKAEAKTEKAAEQTKEQAESVKEPEKEAKKETAKEAKTAKKRGRPKKAVTEEAEQKAKTAEAEQKTKTAEAEQEKPEKTADKSETDETGAKEAKADETKTAAAEAPEREDALGEEKKNAEEEPKKQFQNPANVKEGILEIMPDGFGFIRCDNYLPGPEDVYVPPIQIRRMNLKTGDIINGLIRDKNPGDKFNGLLYVNTVNGFGVGEAIHRKRFEDLTPVFPYERINLETPGCPVAMRMVNLLSPIGKGQRGMIVSQPKAGKTTLLKQIAAAIKTNHPEIHIIVLLIDERPEEVTDMKESIQGDNVEVIYSTFDELPENHKRVSEMVIERAKRLVEHKRDVVILLDSITRLARAYNLTCANSGRTLSGGLDPAALYMPKRFFGAARKMREGGSLTVLATALVDTGSRMDDVVFEEFKGTGNMELVLDRNLSERRIFPAIDLPKSGTRREDLLLTQPEMEANFLMRKALNSVRSEDAVERIIQLYSQTKTNDEFVENIRKYGVLRTQVQN